MANISKIKLPNDSTTYNIQDNISGYATETYVDEQDALDEKLANKVIAISSSSTDDQYPSAKCVYTNVSNKLDISSTTQTKTGDLKIATAGPAHGLTIGSTTNQYYTGVQAVRKCPSDSNNANTAGFIVNADGSAKFTHRRGDESALEDSYFAFDALGLNLYASGTKGETTMPTNPTFSALQGNTRPQFKGSDIALSSDLDDKEDSSNKVTSIDSSSTDTQYPSAKAVYTNLDNKVDKIETESSTYPTTTAYVYGRDSSGNAALFRANTSNAEGTIAIRQEAGTLSVATPTDNSHATTKAYVDSLVGFNVTGIVIFTYDSTNSKWVASNQEYVDYCYNNSKKFAAIFLCQNYWFNLSNNVVITVGSSTRNLKKKIYVGDHSYNYTQYYPMQLDLTSTQVGSGAGSYIYARTRFVENCIWIIEPWGYTSNDETNDPDAMRTSGSNVTIEFIINSHIEGEVTIGEKFEMTYHGYDSTCTLPGGFSLQEITSLLTPFFGGVTQIAVQGSPTGYLDIGTSYYTHGCAIEYDKNLSSRHNRWIPSATAVTTGTANIFPTVPSLSTSYGTFQYVSDIYNWQ